MAPPPRVIPETTIFEYSSFQISRPPTVMENGFYWTTSHVVPGSGSVHRVYELREFPEKPESESRWVARVTVYAQEIRYVAGFRLCDLTAGNINSVVGCSETHSFFHYSYFVPASIWIMVVLAYGKGSGLRQRGWRSREWFSNPIINDDDSYRRMCV
ncbi:hypothetical protein QBC47DRAFT_363536 [Echria macrotheca]|uniref:Uncharacterized protein n=1 Tax=Echria macrotheca TaxID=438768 RepID=A0AAJ0B9A0_9PEZI|nr:hypothetical protein QBC47DRAFT_363536 [Echria macrotheca]